VAIHKSFSNQNILIPHGSAVKAKVSGQSGNVRATAFIAGPGFVPQNQANHPAAWNQTWTRPLNSKGGYSVVIDIDFLAKATVDADLRVVKPDGTVHIAPWMLKITGASGDSVTLSYGLAVL
jgi:hypothetical protein